MILPVQVTFRNMPHSEEIEEMIQAEAAHLEQYYGGIIGCRVMVEVPHRHHLKGAHYHIRIDLTVPGDEIVIKREPRLYALQQDTAMEGNHKSTEVETERKHLEVAIREAFDTARRKLEDYARLQRGDVKTHVGNPTGIVTQVFPEEGYGYIETPDGIEIYFHKNSVLNNDFKHVRVGSLVSYAEEQGIKGPQASTVRLIGEHRHHRMVKEEAV